MTKKIGYVQFTGRFEISDLKVEGIPVKIDDVDLADYGQLKASVVFLSEPERYAFIWVPLIDHNEFKDPNQIAVAEMNYGFRNLISSEDLVLLAWRNSMFFKELINQVYQESNG